MKIFFYNVWVLLLFMTTAANIQAQTGNWSNYTVAFDDSNGKGDTEADPILIGSEGQLAMLAQKVNSGDSYSGKFFKLTADLDLGAHLWTAIGIRANEDIEPKQEMMPFSGIFDGNGRAIHHLILKSAHYDNGLFSTISDGAVVKNLSVMNSEISGMNGIGILIASNYGTVINCNCSGTVEGLSHHAGILVGFNNPGGNIVNCYASGKVLGRNNVGGLVGFNDTGATITNSYCIGSARGNAYVGGLVGVNNGEIVNSYAAGTVRGSSFAGGLAGINGYDGENTDHSNATIINSYACGNVAVETAVAGGFIGENGSPVAITASYFDYQGTGQKSGIGWDTNQQSANVTGLNTPALISGSLPGGFDAAVWQASAGYYPQLKVFGSDNNAKAWSALSVVPLELYNTLERTDSVSTTFRLVAQTALGENIAWSVGPTATAFIGNRWVSSIHTALWDTLTLAAGGCKRTMVYRPANQFSDANILACKVGDTWYENPEPGQIAQMPVDCSYPGSQVEVEVIVNPFADVSPGRTFHADVSKPGSYTQGITVTSVDDKFTNGYTVSIDRLFAAGIFLQRWNDVLAVINNPATNGGYTFTAYDWYKNGNQLGITAGYMQEPGGLDKTAKYTALLTTNTGEQLGTCPAVIADVQVKLLAYPNPVQRGQTVRVETNIPPEAGTAVIRLFDQLGNTIKSMVIRDLVTEISMPFVSGQYLLQVAAGAANQTFKIIVE